MNHGTMYGLIDSYAAVSAAGSGTPFVSIVPPISCPPIHSRKKTHLTIIFASSSLTCLSSFLSLRTLRPRHHPRQHPRPLPRHVPLMPNVKMATHARKTYASTISVPSVPSFRVILVMIATPARPAMCVMLRVHVQEER